MLLLRKAYRCHSKIRLSRARNGEKNEGETSEVVEISAKIPDDIKSS